MLKLSLDKYFDLYVFQVCVVCVELFVCTGISSMFCQWSGRCVSIGHTTAKFVCVELYVFEICFVNGAGDVRQAALQQQSLSVLSCIYFNDVLSMEREMCVKRPRGGE